MVFRHSTDHENSAEALGSPNSSPFLKASPLQLACLLTKIRLQNGVLPIESDVSSVSDTGNWEKQRVVPTRGELRTYIATSQDSLPMSNRRLNVTKAY